jgi:hypothetical protein
MGARSSLVSEALEIMLVWSGIFFIKYYQFILSKKNIYN